MRRFLDMAIAVPLEAEPRTMTGEPLIKTKQREEKRKEKRGRGSTIRASTAKKQKKKQDIETREGVAQVRELTAGFGLE